MDGWKPCGPPRMLPIQLKNTGSILLDRSPSLARETNRGILQMFLYEGNQNKSLEENEQANKRGMTK